MIYGGTLLVHLPTFSAGPQRLYMPEWAGVPSGVGPLERQSKSRVVILSISGNGGRLLRQRNVFEARRR